MEQSQSSTFAESTSFSEHRARRIHLDIRDHHCVTDTIESAFDLSPDFQSTLQFYPDTVGSLSLNGPTWTMVSLNDMAEQLNGCSYITHLELETVFRCARGDDEQLAGLLHSILDSPFLSDLQVLRLSRNPISCKAAMALA